MNVAAESSAAQQLADREASPWDRDQIMRLAPRRTQDSCPQGYSAKPEADLVSGPGMQILHFEAVGQGVEPLQTFAVRLAVR